MYDLLISIDIPRPQHTPTFFVSSVALSVAAQFVSNAGRNVEYWAYKTHHVGRFLDPNVGHGLQICW